MLPGIAWIAECVLTLAVVFFAFTELRAVRARREERTRPIEEGGPFRERPSVSEPSDDGAAGRRARAWAVAAMVVALGAMLDPAWLVANPFIATSSPLDYGPRPLPTASLDAFSFPAVIPTFIYFMLRLTPAALAAIGVSRLPTVGPFAVPSARSIGRVAIALGVLASLVAGARFAAGGLSLSSLHVVGLITPPEARAWQRNLVWSESGGADSPTSAVLRGQPTSSFYDPALVPRRGIACTMGGEPTLITWDDDGPFWRAHRVVDARGFDPSRAPAFHSLPRATSTALFEVEAPAPYAVRIYPQLRVSDMPWVVAPPGWPVVLSGLALAFALFAESRARRDRLGACAWRAFGALAVLESTSIVMAMYCAYF